MVDKATIDFAIMTRRALLMLAKGLEDWIEAQSLSPDEQDPSIPENNTENKQ